MVGGGLRMCVCGEVGMCDDTEKGRHGLLSWLSSVSTLTGGRPPLSLRRLAL